MENGCGVAVFGQADAHAHALCAAFGDLVTQRSDAEARIDALQLELNSMFDTLWAEMNSRSDALWAEMHSARLDCRRRCQP